MESFYDKSIMPLHRRDDRITQLDKYGKANKSCDLVIDVNGIQFFCHKVLLSCTSSYFKCLVKYDLHTSDDADVGRLVLSSVDPSNMQVILDYIYTGDITSNSKDLFDVIYTADYFLLDSMLESLALSLQIYLNVDNVVEYFLVAKHIGCKYICAAVVKFIVRNIYEIHQNKKLLSLTPEDFLEILKDKRLVIRYGNLFVFGIEFKRYAAEIIHEWAKFDEDQRKEYVTELIELLDQLVLEGMNDKHKLESYRYIEPISRAYFFNSIPFGRHPPSLVSAPFNFRCLSRNIKRTFIDNPPHKWFIKRIIFYIIADWNNSAVIGDIQIDYKNHWTGEVQAYRSLIGDHVGCIREEFTLADDERIISMDIYHGWMIYGMRFYTTSKRVAGVFGSSNSELAHIDFQRDYPNALYMHGFAFILVSSKDWNAINWLTVYGAMVDKDVYHQDFNSAFEADVNNEVDIKKDLICSKVSTEEFRIEDESDYPLPQNLEDLFYQWRKCMRTMRLSVIRRHQSILSTRIGSSELLIPDKMEFPPNFSSPEFLYDGRKRET